MNVKMQTTRRESGKTQAQVAKEVGVTELTYQRYEHGTRNPDIYTAFRIADALESTVEYLFRPVT